MHGRHYSQWVYAGHGQVVILQRQRGFDGAAFGLTAQPPGIRQTNPGTSEVCSELQAVILEALCFFYVLGFERKSPRTLKAKDNCLKFFFYFGGC